MIVPYRVGAALPDLTLRWEDADGGVINFAAGYTFALRAAPQGSTTALLTKTTGITGASADPNVTVGFTVAELALLVATLAPAATLYDVQVRATRTADSKPRDFPGAIVISVLPSIA